MAKPIKIKNLLLFENEDYALVNKPPYYPSVPERGKVTNVSILELAKAQWPEAIMCHRLDRETSGVLIIAKNPEAYRHASIQFEKRKVSKVYHAIVEGRLQFDNLKVDLPINMDDLDNIHISKKTGKKAETWFQSLQIFKQFTLVECRPVTGRLHQIRVHLASQNAKIAADELYGASIPFLSVIKRKLSGSDTQLMSRFALHAKQITLILPDGSELTAEAPYPKDFEVFLKLLNKYNA